MNALIVYAHPEPHRSINAALRDVVATTLRELGNDVVISDLYAQKFDAVAGPRDFTRLVNPEHFGLVHEQRHAAVERRYVREILDEQDKLSDAELVIFQFPLWWYSVPAILKGWVDRVLSYGFAYTDENTFRTGLLRGKRTLVSVTTGGSEGELAEDSVHTGTVEQFLKPFLGGVLGYVGMDVLPPYVAFAPAELASNNRVRQLEALQAAVVHACAATNPAPHRGLARWQVDRVMSYLRQHLAMALDLTELASVLELSRFHFCSSFRLATGETPHVALTRVRMERARQLLGDPDLQVTDVALAVGYQTPSAFAAAFRRVVGMSPTAYRRRR